MSLARVSARIPSENRLPYERWAALVLFLVIEVVAFTVHFDVGDLPTDAAWSVDRLMRIGVLVHPGIVAAIASVCLGAGTIQSALLGSAGRLSRWNFWPSLLGHVVAMTLFVGLSDALFAGLARSRYADLVIALWLAIGLSSLALWGASLVPWSLWPSVARAAWKAIAAGIGAGALAMLAGTWTSDVWQNFHHSTFRMVSTILGLFSGDLTCEPANFVIGVRGFSVRIASGCSGYEGIGLIWVFLGVYIYLFRRELRFPTALLLLPIGTAVIWFANCVRIAALVMIGVAGYPGVAVGGFHSQSGWIAFNLVGLGLVLASRACGLFSRDSRPAVMASEPLNPTTPYVMPLLVLVGTSMIAAASSAGGFDRYYPARVAATATALWWFRRRYAEIARSWSWSWTPVAIGVAVFAAWMAMEPTPSGSDGANPIPAALRAMPPIVALGWIAFRIIGSVVTVPIVEELAFRGFLLRWLIDRDFEGVQPVRFAWFSFFASSACFGALHGRWLAGFVAGMAYALAYHHRGRLGDAIVAHAVTNGLIAGLVLATGAWSLWI